MNYSRSDLAYVDAAEALAMCNEAAYSHSATEAQGAMQHALAWLGYPMQGSGRMGRPTGRKCHQNARDMQVYCINSVSQFYCPISSRLQISPHYYEDSWPKRLRIELIKLPLGERATTIVLDDGDELHPCVPFSQLVRFLNAHVAGKVGRLLIYCPDVHSESILLDCLSAVDPRLLHGCHEITFYTLFRSLPATAIRQLFDVIFRSVEVLSFFDLLLSGTSGLFADDDFLQLEAVKECETLQIYTLLGVDTDMDRVLAIAAITGRRWPKFSTVALLALLNSASAVGAPTKRRVLRLSEEYIAEGVEHFVEALIKVRYDIKAILTHFGTNSGFHDCLPSPTVALHRRRDVPDEEEPGRLADGCSHALRRGCQCARRATGDRDGLGHTRGMHREAQVPLCVCRSRLLRRERTGLVQL